MSLNQMLCHVTDSFRCPLGQRTVAPFKATSLPVPVLKWLALNFPRKWPQDVPTTPEMNQRIGGTPPAGFRQDRDTLLEKLNKFAQFSGSWARHPMFGPLTSAEWMRWAYLHTDHHLRQFGR
jgi:hypothetical protein